MHLRLNARVGMRSVTGRRFRLAQDMNLLRRLHSCLRSLFQEQIPRRIPRRCVKPRIGSYVVHVQSQLRLVVQAGMTDDLWHWLMDQGWRVEPYRPDRRAYRDIPASYVTQLIDADPSDWRPLMDEAIQCAQTKPVLIWR